MAKEDFVVKQQAVLSADPSAPGSGRSIIYPKSDGQWYIINSDGTIKAVTNQNPNNPLMVQIFS